MDEWDWDMSDGELLDKRGDQHLRALARDCPHLVADRLALIATDRWDGSKDAAVIAATAAVIAWLPEERARLQLALDQNAEELLREAESVLESQKKRLADLCLELDQVPGALAQAKKDLDVAQSSRTRLRTNLSRALAGLTYERPPSHLSLPIRELIRAGLEPGDLAPDLARVAEEGSGGES